MRAVALLGLLVSCAAVGDLRVPVEITDGAGTLIFAVTRGEDLLLLQVVDGRSERAGVVLTPGDDLWLYRYQEPPAALGLTPGPLATVSDAPKRRLPAAAGLYHADPGPGAWVPMQAPPAALLAARIRGLAGEECPAAGGCVTWDEQEERCALPCPALSPITAPAAPDLPIVEGCPAGWIMATRPGQDAPRRCEPPPRLTCPPGQLQLLADGGGCAPPSPACARPFPPAPPGARALHIRAGAAGGDGSAAAPLGSISQALALAAGPTYLLLSGGVYQEGVRLTDRVELLGSCAEDVRIEGAIDVAPAAASRIVGVTLLGPTDKPLLRVEPGASLELREAELIGGAPAIEVQPTAQLGAQRILIRGSWSAGVYVLGAGARASVSAAEVREFQGAGMAATASGMLTVDESLIHGAGGGRGVVAGGDSEVRVEESWIRDCGAAVHGTDAALLSVSSSALSTNRTGVAAFRTADLRVDRVLVADSEGSGLYLEENLAQVTDSVIEGTRAAVMFGQEGIGVQQAGGTSTFTRVLIDGAERAGLLLQTMGILTTDSLWIRDVRDDAVGRGYGLHVTEHARIGARRVLVQDVSSSAVVLEAYSDAGMQRLSDLRVERAAGTGLALYRGWLELERAALSQVRSAGVDATQLCPTLGLPVADGDLRAQIRDLSVDLVHTPLLAQPCGKDFAIGTAFGLAVRGCVPTIDAYLDLLRFRLSTQVDRSFGLCANLASRPTLADGLVEGNQVGAVLAEPARTSLRDVVFRDNSAADVTVLGGP